MSKNIAKLNINNVDFTFKDAELRNTVSGLISEINNSNKVIATSLNDLDSRIPDISGKVDKIEGKGLSTEDYTTEEKTKLSGIAAGAEVNVQSDWNATSGAAQILNKPNIRQYNGEFATEDVIVADQNYFADRYVSITDGTNSIVLDDMDDAGITIHGYGNDGFINLIAGENIRLSTTGTYKAYYNNKEIATVDDIVQSDWNATSGSAQILNKPNITNNNGNLNIEPSTQFGNINISTHFDTGDITVYGGDKLYLNSGDDSVYINNTIRVDSESGPAYYKNKEIATVDDIVQSDWNATSGAAQILNKPDIPQEVITGEIVGRFHRDDVSGSGQITIKGNSGQGFGSTSIATAGTYTVVVYSWSATQSFGYNVSFGGNNYTISTTDGTISDKRDFTVSGGALWTASVTQAVATGTTLIVEIYNKSKLTPVLSVGTAALTNLYNDLDGKPTLSKATSGSGNAVTDISVSDHKITLTKGSTFLTANDITGKADKSSAISTLSLSLDPTTYVLTLAGTKADGTTFTVDNTIDLPLESVVVDGSYNTTTKEVELELKSGTTVSFSIADLISGLQSEITSSNKLSADLTKDGTTNKVYTATEKTKLANLPTIEELDDVHETIASALNDLDSRIEDINEVGAQANVIEAIKVNDELLPITDKTVNIYDIKYIHIDQTSGTDEHDEGVTRYLSNFRDSSITPEYFQDLATKYDLNHNFSTPANNSNVIFVTHDPDIGIFNYVYDKAFSSYFITDENESVDDFKTLALLLSTKNNIINLTNFNEEYGCCIIKWDNENNKWKFRWIEYKKSITTGDSMFSIDRTRTIISAFDADHTNNNAKIELVGYTSESIDNNNAQINITTQTDDGLRWNGRVVAVEEDYSTEYLTFVAKESGTFTFTPQNNNVISYSTDNEETWTVGNSVTVNNGDKVLWKGTMTPGINGIGTFSSTTNFDVQGNVMSLLFGDEFIGKTNLTGKNGAFVQLFYQNAKLVNAENLSLPATTLANDCYHSMFNGCTSLVNAPELPATTLAIYCYHSMFYGCTSLTTAPELPGTILVDGCYNNMFCNCFSLNYIRAMFTTTPGSQYTSTWVYGVSSTGIFIKNPLASWDVRGYDGIPQYWNNYLSTEIDTINNKIQKIDPLILANNEYYIQKSNSVILPLSHPDLSTQPSILPERFGKYYIYEVMVPIFGDNIINDLSNASDEEIYVYETNNESYLAFKEGGLLMNDSTIINASLIGNGVYDNPTIIKDEIIEEIDYANEYLTFVAKESGTFTFTAANNNVIDYSIDNGLTWTEGNEVTVNSGDKVLWKGMMTPNGTSGIGTFSSTAKFDIQGNIMSLLFGDDFIEQIDLTGKNWVFYRLFYSNTKVVSAENLILPATTLVDNCYSYMFYGCTSLITAPELPATTLTYSCYNSMFYNCTSLTKAPELPATTLTYSCYNSMFQGCSSLNYIIAMFTTTPSASYTSSWVSGVSSIGIFFKNSVATWDVTGVNGKPAGWTVDTVSYEDVPYEYSTTGIIDQFKINKIYTNLPLSTYASKMNYLLVKYYNDQYLGDYGNYYE